MRVIAVFSVLALAGCLEDPGPSPAVLQLQAACQSGNLNACSQVAAIEQQDQQARAAMFRQISENQRRTGEANAQLFQNTFTQNRQVNTTCTRDYVGTVHCRSY